VALLTLDERFLAACHAVKADGELRSDRALSLALGLNENYIQRVRSGQQSPQTEAIRQLVLKFRVNADWLFTGSGEMFGADRKPLLALGASPGEYNAQLALSRMAKEPRVTIIDPLPEDRLARVERQQALLLDGIAELLTKLKQA
jgi:hypothetical protein